MAWDGVERREASGVEILNIHRRMDNQDEVLREQSRVLGQISEKLSVHIEMDAAVKPSVDELVTMLKGMKFLRAAVLFVAPLGAVVWQAFVWFRDHFRMHG